MVLAARLSADLGRAPPADTTRLAALLSALGLPVTLPPSDPTRLLELMRLDKKNLGDSLRLILWRGIGHAEIVADVDTRAIMGVLRDG
jgi:3-dehydroquinate synthase